MYTDWSELLKNENMQKSDIDPSLLGQKHNRLTIVSDIKFSDKIKNGKWFCVVRCDCSNKVKKACLHRVKSGIIKSCGCLAKEALLKNITKHGKHGTRLYKTWKNMTRRCRGNHKNYGGRGISVCEGWLTSYEEFYQWATKNGYSDDLTIDRIDFNGNYEPSNCRWMTQSQNSHNKKYPNKISGKKSKYKGVRLTNKSTVIWSARITFNKKEMHLGTFNNEDDAARAYNKKAKELFGEHADLNIIEGDE